jgi:L-asparaginase II
MTDAQIVWTEAEREAVARAVYPWGWHFERARDAALAALAPFVAERVAKARADGMREAAGIAQGLSESLACEERALGADRAADAILAAIEKKEPTT